MRLVSCLVRSLDALAAARVFFRAAEAPAGVYALAGLLLARSLDAADAARDFFRAASDPALTCEAALGAVFLLGAVFFGLVDPGDRLCSRVALAAGLAGVGFAADLPLLTNFFSFVDCALVSGTPPPALRLMSAFFKATIRCCLVAFSLLPPGLYELLELLLGAFGDAEPAFAGAALAAFALASSRSLSVLTLAVVFPGDGRSFLSSAEPAFVAFAAAFRRSLCAFAAARFLRSSGVRRLGYL